MNLPVAAKKTKPTFKIPQPVVVRLTSFSPRSVAKWSEGVAPSLKQEKALVEMDRLLDGLSRVMRALLEARMIAEMDKARRPHRRAHRNGVAPRRKTAVA